MRYPDSDITSISDLLGSLGGRREGGLPIWYRGQSSPWRLRPSLARKEHGVAAEMTVIKRFKQNAHLLLSPLPFDEWEWLYIMQHHGAPTRLLDWTENPLVALYFAVTAKPKISGELWVLLPTELNTESRIKPDFKGDIPGFTDEAMQNYMPSRLAAEKTSSLWPIAGIAPRNTPRMQVQLGTFTIHHRDRIAIDQVGAQQHVWRYTIPAAAKKVVAEELQTMAMTKLSLFPELSSVGESVKGVI
ncbi:MAG: FRG domain-containing protein [Verrucomicrobia bacterium]|nr:FRG domain-containing protein [Verrucomicrobiota bacterium]